MGGRRWEIVSFLDNVIKGFFIFGLYGVFGKFINNSILIYVVGELGVRLGVWV